MFIATAIRPTSRVSTSAWTADARRGDRADQKRTHANPRFRERSIDDRADGDADEHADVRSCDEADQDN